MADEILYNSPALHALKRHQLVSLSKRHGLKASGKNTDMIARLQDYATTLTPSRALHLPHPVPTPDPESAFNDFGVEDPPSSPLDDAHGNKPFIRASAPSPLDDHRRLCGLSDTWEVLTESGASFISPKGEQMSKSDSVRSWKSANNGLRLSEFGAHAPANLGSFKSTSSSVRSLASSFSRRASRHLPSRSVSASSRMDKSTTTLKQESQAAEHVEEIQDVPPSPASTVGVPRRYSAISLLERASTIRLVSPEPTSAPAESDVLPFFNSAAVKQRRSMAPLWSPPPSSHSSALNRKSMPALVSFESASVPSIYPSLPAIPPVPDLPGAFPGARTISGPAVPPQVFQFSISNDQFEDAGKKVLAEMAAKFSASTGTSAPSFGTELLKGKKAEMTKLVNVRQGIGEGGWGLASISLSDMKDRYADAHKKEFARMQSIKGKTAKCAESSGLDKATSMGFLLTPGKRKLSDGLPGPSAPNGLPYAGNQGRETKRKKMSPGPNGLLMGAGKLLGTKVSTPKRRRQSIGKNGGLATRFGLFRAKSRTPAREMATRLPEPVAAAPAGPVSSASSKPSVPPSAPTSTLQRSTTSLQGFVAKPRAGSTSAQSTLSAASKIRPRARIPDFAPPPSAMSRSTSSNVLASSNMSRSKSSSLSSHQQSMRKASQADLIRNARPAPLPPSLSSSQSSKILPSVTTNSMKRSSRLYAPTASSLARMQATVKPEAARPASPAPVIAPAGIATTRPFGNSTSRANFDSSFNVPPPTNTSLATLNKPIAKVASVGNLHKASPIRTPNKAHSSVALRAKQRVSGLSAVKSKGNLRSEAEVGARRAAIRSKQERLAEERELRQLLGNTSGGDVNM